MREIKFRAYDEVSCRMEYDISSIIQDGSICMMQFTGLLDKNGKDIFEGDIVEDKHGIIYQIEYKGCEFIKNDKLTTTNLLHSLVYLEIEVIGNIFESPELIKQ